jgi:DNA-binding transcriptional MocR family regulator
MNEEINIFAIVPVEACMDKRLTLECMRVLVALMSFRRKNTELAWPSRAQISQRTGMHISNISDATTKLEALGWISKEGKGGFSKSTRYTISVPDLEQIKVAEQTTVAGSATVADSATGLPLADSATRKEQTKNKSLKPKSPKTEKVDPKLMVLPDGLTAEKWNEWLKYRTEKKKTVTYTTAIHQLKQIEKWISQGHNANEVIDFSIMQGYQGLFLPKPHSAKQTRYDPAAANLDKMRRNSQQEKEVEGERV